MALTAPFLRQARLDPAKVEHGEFPFGTVAFLTEDFELRFDSAATIFVGENGPGKSTLIEPMAKACGFSAQGYRTGEVETENTLTKALRFSRLPKVNRGFFFRAESFFNYQIYIDRSYDEAGGIASGMHLRSRGEAFLQAFLDRLEAGISEAKPCIRKNKAA